MFAIVQGNSVTVMIDGETVGSEIYTQSVQGGFVGMGAGGFYLVTFDDFYLLQGSCRYMYMYNVMYLII